MRDAVDIADRIAQGDLTHEIESQREDEIGSMLRRLLTAAGLPDAEEYSSHSLRRGFAGWANANGWDVKALMEYVGWRDVHSAMRYLDGSDPFARHRIEASLPPPALPAP